MRRSLLAWVFLALLATVLSAGCAGVPPSLVSPGEPAAEPTRTLTHDSETEANVTATPTPQPTPSGPSAEAQAAVDRAREDLAQQLDLRIETVRLVAVESRQWPDASLGCPQPDTMYAQVITPGYRVILRAAGQVYTYHTDREKHLILCEKAPLPSEAASPALVEPGLERLANQAREDLAAKLSIPVEQIEGLEATSVVWPDGSLGCPQPDMAYTQVQREGVLIRLRAGGRIYSYHGGAGLAPFLCEQATTDVDAGD